MSVSCLKADTACKQTNVTFMNKSLFSPLGGFLRRDILNLEFVCCYKQGWKQQLDSHYAVKSFQ